MRALVSFFVGGVFGLGLLLSGMTQTTKVQGWLDLFGDWDPTLAFVMGGAIIPMAIAWQFTRTRTPVLGGSFPVKPSITLDRRLIVGSVMFGMGWGLTGLCPGPAMASLTFGGLGGLLFIGSMTAGMIVAPRFALRLDDLLQSD
jgi:uncharacterized membrane protein YedE/YeeE